MISYIQDKTINANNSNLFHLIKMMLSVQKSEKHSVGARCSVPLHQ
jgi:hypothetical protein